MIVQDWRTPVPEALSNRQNSVVDAGYEVSRHLVERYVVRISVRPQAIEIHTLDVSSTDKNNEVKKRRSTRSNRPPAIISIPWSATATEAVKGVLHAPSSDRTMSPESRDAILTAIAKARVWIDDIVEGKAASFAEIAKREGKVERHVRFLAPLAFLSPRIVSAIIDGSAPGDLTITGLAKSLPCSWFEQKQRQRLPQTSSSL